MRIGKQDAPYTAICTSDAESITVRGHDLVGELMGEIDFTSSSNFARSPASLVLSSTDFLLRL